MKKLALALTAVLSMGLASMGFASPASDLLNQEEKTVTQVVNLLQGQGELADVSKNFTPELQKNFNDKALSNMQKGVTDQLGKVSDATLVRLDKFPDADRLIYLGKARKSPNVQLTFLFVTKDKKVLLQGVNVTPVEIKTENTQDKAAAAK